jgi:hypothetical protein
VCAALLIAGGGVGVEPLSCLMPLLVISAALAFVGRAATRGADH